MSTAARTQSRWAKQVPVNEGVGEAGSRTGWMENVSVETVKAGERPVHVRTGSVFGVGSRTLDDLSPSKSPRDQTISGGWAGPWRSQMSDDQHQRWRDAMRAPAGQGLETTKAVRVLETPGLPVAMEEPKDDPVF